MNWELPRSYRWPLGTLDDPWSWCLRRNRSMSVPFQKSSILMRNFDLNLHFNRLLQKCVVSNSGVDAHRHRYMLLLLNGHTLTQLWDSLFEVGFGHLLGRLRISCPSDIFTVAVLDNLATCLSVRMSVRKVPHFTNVGYENQKTMLILLSFPL